MNLRTLEEKVKEAVAKEDLLKSRISSLYYAFSAGVLPKYNGYLFWKRCPFCKDKLITTKIKRNIATYSYYKCLNPNCDCQLPPAKAGGLPLPDGRASGSIDSDPLLRRAVNLRRMF